MELHFWKPLLTKLLSSEKRFYGPQKEKGGQKTAFLELENVRLLPNCDWRREAKEKSTL